MKNLALVFLIILFGCKATSTVTTSSSGDLFAPKSGVPSIESFTTGMMSFDGFFRFHWDTDKDKIYLEIDKLNSEFLYVNALAAGVGSNDIGLDRGQLGGERIVRFEQHGQKVLLVQPNQDFRAISDNEQEVKSVREAFASSVLYGFPVKAKSDWNVLIDLTDFLLQDAHDVSGRLARAKQGTYRLDLSRSALYKENILNFPKNTDLPKQI